MNIGKTVFSQVMDFIPIAIIKKRLNLEFSLYTILQILSVTVFEKVPITQLLNNLYLQKTRLHVS